MEISIAKIIIVSGSLKLIQVLHDAPTDSMHWSILSPLSPYVHPVIKWGADLSFKFISQTTVSATKYIMNF